MHEQSSALQYLQGEEQVLYKFRTELCKNQPMWSLLLVFASIQQRCRGPVLLAPKKPMVVACADETSRLMLVL